MSEFGKNTGKTTSWARWNFETTLCKNSKTLRKGESSCKTPSSVTLLAEASAIRKATFLEREAGEQEAMDSNRGLISLAKAKTERDL